ncbi:AAA family ATPase [Blastopirellula sp. JC732]|uniref:AAA family ATPase n=1 Tax=Blastopirellula sediminis TaxID=2894196 RepID=A0A9X1SFD6_9BACT|nr:AAA family ATPase [Blastopirellula sediminis]MCC9609582.1 AAA family ATPase [Blastopirellula sediminis]MCC9627642.1 AAA family ATPase [Blastopirellula sediminis]
MKPRSAEKLEAAWLACILSQPELLDDYELPPGAFQLPWHEDLYSTLCTARMRRYDEAEIVWRLTSAGYDEREATQLLRKIWRSERDLSSLPRYTAELGKRAAQQAAALLSLRRHNEIVALNVSPPPFETQSFSQLLQSAEATEWLLPGLLARNSPGVILGPGKTLKTSLAVDLCGALASGGKFLGQYEATRPYRVGFVSGDDRQVLLDLARRWSDASKPDRKRLDDNWICSLSLADLARDENLHELQKWIWKNQLEVVLLDPQELLPLMSKRKQAELLRTITRLCLECGATPLVCCQTRKSLPLRAMQYADLQASGCEAFARQWLLVNRRQAYQPGSGAHQLWLTFGGDAGHEGVVGVDIAEGNLQDPGGKRWEVNLRAPEAIEQESAQRTHEETEERRSDTIRKAIGQLPESHASKSQIRTQAGMNGPRFTATWNRMIAAGEIEPVPDSAAKHQSAVPRFQLTRAPQEKNEPDPVPKNTSPRREPRECVGECLMTND